MSYKLKFTKKSFKDINKLDSAIKNQFYKKLKERVESPRVELKSGFFYSLVGMLQNLEVIVNPCRIFYRIEKKPAKAGF